MAKSFEEILKMNASDIKPPPAYPVGTYHCIVDGKPEEGKSSQKGTPYIRVRFKITGVGDDVNAAEAAEQQIIGKMFQHDFYITEDASWRFTEFLLEHLGIDDGKIDEMLSRCQGQQCLVTLRHELSQDGKRVFHRVHSTAHV